MKAVKLHWLDLAEYLILLSTVIGLIIYLFFDRLIWFLVLTVLSLTLNLVNRLRYRYKTNQKIASSLKRLNQDSLDININKINQTEDSLEQINLIEQGLNKIIKYLEDNRLIERISSLENQQQTVLKSEKNSKETKATILNNSHTKINCNYELINSIQGHEDAVTSLVINNQENWLFSVSWDKTLKMWNLKTGELIDSLEAHNQGILAVTCNQQQVITGGFDQEIKIWSIINSQEKEPLKTERTLTHHSGSIHDLAIANQRDILISGSYDQTIKQWDLKNGDKIASSLDESGAIYAVDVYEAKKIIVSGSGDGTVNLWELATGKHQGILYGNISSVQSIAISQDGELVAVGCVDGTIKLWQLSKPEQPLSILNAHDGQVMSLVFHPDNLLFSGGAEGSIKIWHKNSEKALAVFPDLQQRIFSLALNESGDLLVSGTLEGMIRIWSVNLK